MIRSTQEGDWGSGELGTGGGDNDAIVDGFLFAEGGKSDS